jgi:hypothetical protein
MAARISGVVLLPRLGPAIQRFGPRDHLLDLVV